MFPNIFNTRHNPMSGGYQAAEGADLMEQLRQLQQSQQQLQGQDFYGADAMRRGMYQTMESLKDRMSQEAAGRGMTPQEMYAPMSRADQLMQQRREMDELAMMKANPTGQQGLVDRLTGGYLSRNPFYEQQATAAQTNPDVQGALHGFNRFADLMGAVAPYIPKGGQDQATKGWMPGLSGLMGMISQVRQGNPLSSYSDVGTQAEINPGQDRLRRVGLDETFDPQIRDIGGLAAQIPDMYRYGKKAYDAAKGGGPTGIFHGAAALTNALDKVLDYSQLRQPIQAPTYLPGVPERSF